MFCAIFNFQTRSSPSHSLYRNPSNNNSYFHFCSNLHSNMVLLILKRMISAATTVTAFTFQYGSINTLTLRNWCTTLFHLHSSMVLLILWKRQLKIIILIYLHSSMVLLIQTTGRIVKQRDWHLHSSIVLLILSTNVPSGYSYFIFTFQYSSINTWYWWLWTVRNHEFTFQYSSINT